MFAVGFGTTTEPVNVGLLIGAFVDTAVFTSPICAKSSLVFEIKTDSPIILPFIILFISLASSKL